MESENINIVNSIIVCDYYDTGLLKNGEPVAIESIIGVDEKLKNEFNDWLNEGLELLKPFTFTIQMLSLYRPRLAEIKYHNQIGFELAKRIKSVVGSDVKVYYGYVDISVLLEQAKNR